MRCREPFLIPAIAFASGILTARFAHFSFLELGIASLACLLLCFLATHQARRIRILPAVFVWIFAGAASAEWHRPLLPPQLDSEPNEELLVSGCVTEPPEHGIGRERFVVSLEPGARIRISVIPRGDDPPPILHYGNLVEVETKVRKPHNFQNPGSFNFVGYLHRQNIYWTGSVRNGKKIRVQPGICGSAALRFIYAVRENVLERIQRLYRGDDYSSGLMSALLVGDTSQVEKIWTRDYRHTGTYHALVVSGLHVSVLAAALLFLFRLASIPDLYRRSICLILAWFYAVMAGWQAPVIRSAGGFTLFLIAGFFFRKARILNVLAAVALVFLAFDPSQLFEGSFQLSFLAVAAIGALAVPWLDRWAEPTASGLRAIGDLRRDPRLPPAISQLRVELRLFAETLSLYTSIPVLWWSVTLSLAGRLVIWIYAGFVLSLCVGVAMAVPMALYFHRLSLTSVSANLLVVPALNVAIVSGFAAVATGWQWLGDIARWMLRFSGAVAEWHSQWEVAPRIPDPAVWLGLAFCVALILSAWGLRRRSRVVMFPATAASALLLGIMAAYRVPPDVANRTLEMTAIDVGQGDSVLLILPDKTTILVDGGGISAFDGRQSSLDIGEDVVSPYLWRRGFRILDVIVCTHSHQDHAGGLSALIRNFRPREVWAGAGPDTPGWRAIETLAREGGAEVKRLRAGSGFEQGGATLDVLAPAVDYVAGETPKNDDSLVLLVSYGKHRFLLTGDAEKRTEARLLADQTLRRVDVLKVGHHGSKTSSTEAFLNTVDPTFSIISAGLDNPFGHPHPTVMSRLLAGHSQVFRTDVQGLTTFLSDGVRLSVSSEMGR